MSDPSSHKLAPRVPPGSSSAARVPKGDGSGSDQASGSNAEMTIISQRSPAPSLAFGRGAAPLESANLLEGERLGQFVLQKFIGGGGMGIVFRALDTTLNREVALKVLSRDQSADDEALRRFRNEAQSAARLDHDNIARVHYVGEDRGVHYIVFEFIEGVNIRDLVEQNGPLPLDHAVSYTYQIAQALDHASQRAVIHRDIKPSNVLITPDGKAKLVDMGLARLNQVAQADNDLTASGVTLGTFDYISPEQARDPRSADVRSDMYSLGCSFFYMLTGRPPFPEGTVLQKLLQHQGDHPPDPRTFRPELPVEVSRILARLLAKNPAQRFQDPGELIVELSALAEKAGVHLSSPRVAWTPPHPAPPARWRHHLPWVASVVALLVVVFILDQLGSEESARKAAGPVAPATSTKVAPSSRARTGGADATSSPAPPDEAPTNNPDETTKVPRPIVDKPAKGLAADASSDEGPRTAGDATIVRPEPDRARLGGALEVQPLTARAAAAAGITGRLPPPPVVSPSQLDVSNGSQPPATDQTESDADPQVVPDNVLIVGNGGGGLRTYASLRTALGEAKDGDVIELRYNGRRVEKPMTIANTEVTIRSGDQYQPVVVFRPEANLLEYPPSMVTITGGQLTAKGLHFELDLTRDVSAEWALFETQRADLARFERCTFTIKNASQDHTAYHAGVAFFDVQAAPRASSMAMDPSNVEDHVVAIELLQCVARGEAAFVRSNELQSLDLRWDNGLLATSERLLVAEGGPTQPEQKDGRVRIQLRHVTAAVHEGLALLTNSKDAPYQLVTELDCSDTIVVSTARPPLVEQRGSDDLAAYQARLQWSGERDFFEGFEVFWQIESGAPDEALQMRFADWRDLWASRLRSASTAAVFKPGSLPAERRPFHLHTPADYALDTSRVGNPAVGAAGDGQDAGCLEMQLPALPGEELGGPPTGGDATKPRTDGADEP